MSRQIAVFIFALLTFQVFAQPQEYYFRLTVQDGADVDQLTRIFSIDNVKGNVIYGYANDREWQQLLGLGYQPERLPHPGSLYEHRMSESLPEFTMDWDTYPTYGGYLDMMAQYADSFSAICRLDTFGYSVWR